MCYDCTAALGGCKHQLALLGSMHRRSEDKTPTEKECYWKKSKLSKAGTTIKFILAKKIGSKERDLKKKTKWKKKTKETLSKTKNKRIRKKRMKLIPQHPFTDLFLRKSLITWIIK